LESASALSILQVRETYIERKLSEIRRCLFSRLINGHMGDCCVSGRFAGFRRYCTQPLTITSTPTENLKGCCNFLRPGSSHSWKSSFPWKLRPYIFVYLSTQPSSRMLLVLIARMTLETCNVHPMNLKIWERADPNLFSVAEPDFKPKTARHRL
jgi:hypothetical protein